MARIELSEIHSCYSVADIRTLEAFAMEVQGVSGIQLMTKAGRVAFEVIEQSYSPATKLYIFCGGGNNGGDGFVVAGLAADADWSVCLIDLSNPKKLSDAARQARNFALERVQEVINKLPDLTGQEVDQAGLLVDALVGIGFSGELRGRPLDACQRINQSNLPVVSLDVPSGINADTGACATEAIQADITISFIGAKRGLLTGCAQNCVGELIVDDLEINAPDDLPLSPHEILTSKKVKEVFPARVASAHKGGYGHLLIIGGNSGMAGAAILAAEAALSLGVGKISVATRESSLAPLLSKAPEVMAHQVEHYNYLQPLLDKCTAVVIGPGLGTDSWAEQMLHCVLRNDLPTLIDADAINLIAAGVVTPSKDRICFTPHPGEAAGILGVSTRAVQENRFEAVQGLQSKLPGHWLLKGNGSLVSRADKPAYLNRTGNPGMASGGMGDVLSGLVGSIMAQGYSVESSAAAGTYLHGTAADIATQKCGQISLRASDLISAIPDTLLSMEVQND
tara:strand:- start:11042 stop:12568 length:1527 start_codon:yes stop_codon:yes gene_type:complete